MRVPHPRRALAGALTVFALAFVSLACQPGSAVALKVGDCFDQTPSVDANGNGIVVDSIVDCAQPHDAEVYLVFDYPGSPDAYPGDEAIGSLQQTRCQAAFEAYVGKDPDLSSYTINYRRPDVDSWSSGDRSIACLIEDASGGQLTGSARGSNR
jgi:Septum formation